LGFNPYSETSITDSLIEFTSKKYDLSEILENSKKITQNQRENIVIKQFYEGVSFLKNKKIYNLDII